MGELDVLDRVLEMSEGVAETAEPWRWYVEYGVRLLDTFIPVLVPLTLFESTAGRD